MTEEEAKKKWCPMVRVAGAGNVSTDNGKATVLQFQCIGSACMMWRFHGYLDGRPSEQGYCGLAGKP